MEELIKRLNAICDEQPYTTAWYVKNLVTGEDAIDMVIRHFLSVVPVKYLL